MTGLGQVFSVFCNYAPSGMGGAMGCGQGGATPTAAYNNPHATPTPLPNQLTSEQMDRVQQMLTKGNEIVTDMRQRAGVQATPKQQTKAESSRRQGEHGHKGQRGTHGHGKCGEQGSRKTNRQSKQQLFKDVPCSDEYELGQVRQFGCEGRNSKNYPQSVKRELGKACKGYAACYNNASSGDQNAFDDGALNGNQGKTAVARCRERINRPVKQAACAAFMKCVGQNHNKGKG